MEAAARDNHTLMMVFDTLAEAEAALRLLQEADLPPSPAFVCREAAELARLDLPAEDTAPYNRYLQQGRVVAAVRAAAAARARVRAILEPAGAYAVRWREDPRPGAAAPGGGPGHAAAAPAFVLDMAGAGDRDLHSLAAPLAGPLPPTETEFRSGGEASRAAQTPAP